MNNCDHPKKNEEETLRLSIEEWWKIINMHLADHFNQDITKELGIHHRTVARTLVWWEATGSVEDLLDWVAT